MVKKMKKYVKFVVCMALIMGLVAPSYAALSASDGSAFVTKAEFDSALADFNARLTTFEAGINSKIDSQVTSYLDRNGIWNGKQCDFIGNLYNDVDYYLPQNGGLYKTSEYTLSEEEGITTDGDPYKVIWTKGTSTAYYQVGGNSVPVKYYYRMKPNSYILYGCPLTWQANKSGMLVANIRLTGRDPQRGYQFWVHNSANNYTCYAFNDGYCWLRGKVNDDGFYKSMDDFPNFNETYIPEGEFIVGLPTFSSNQICSMIQQSVKVLSLGVKPPEGIDHWIHYGSSQLNVGTGTWQSSVQEDLEPKSKDDWVWTDGATIDSYVFLTAGTYVNSFFVQKGEYISFVKYKYFVGPGFDEVIWKLTSGGGQIVVSDYDLNVY